MSTVRPFFVGCAALATACSEPPAPVWSAGAPETIEAADHLFAADIDGDGHDELGQVVGETVRVGTTEHTLEGVFQRAVAVPQNGREVVWMASGQGRGNTGAPVRITELSGDGVRAVWERQGDRDQVTDLRVHGDRVWAAVYADAKRVSGGWLTDAGFEAVTREHMGQRQVPLDDGSVVVGRVYGPAPKSPGDLRRVSDDTKTSTTLTSLRGVRALALADLDGDGHDDLISGDGWHYAYGKEGDARVVVHRGPDFTDARVVGWVPDSYAALSIVPVGTGTNTGLVVRGSHRVVLLARDPLGWGVVDLGRVSELGSIAVLDAETAPKVAIPGDKPRIVPLVLEAP